MAAQPTDSDGQTAFPFPGFTKAKKWNGAPIETSDSFQFANLFYVRRDLFSKTIEIVVTHWEIMFFR